MAEKGKKPEGSLEGINIFLGLENPPQPEGEVVGDISPFPGAYYTCFADLCVNWVPGGWTFFICRCDGVLNLV
jgi:hypothetical protein